MQAAQLLSNELGEFCESESLSQEGLREIINRHGGAGDISNYDFFLNACWNERVDEGIIQCLLEYFPPVADATDVECGWKPLHYACRNKNVTLGIIQLLINAAPESVRTTDNYGKMPLHVACEYKNVTLGIIQLLIDAAPESVRAAAANGGKPLHFFCGKDMDKTAEIEILKLLLEKCPESARHATDAHYLPIHFAVLSRTVEFCHLLIQAYPGSIRISADGSGALPLHAACMANNLPMVEFLYNLYPDAINTTANDGVYPIHCAIHGLLHEYSYTQRSPMAALNIVRFLLDCDPSVKLQRVQGISVLQIASWFDYNDSNIDEGMQIVMALYDAYPEVIEEDIFVPNPVFQLCHQQVQTFINAELVHARQARDQRQMMAHDERGQLPLHRALQDNVRLGSIKLLVKGNPSAVRTVDKNCAFPFHVACEYHDSPSVVQYLLDLDPTTLRHLDFENDSALHYACRGAKYDTIALLLEKYDAASVSKRNIHKQLPIDLLWESSEVEDRESVEYTDMVFRLLRAYPETLMNIGLQMEHQATSENSSSHNGKKRKLDAV